MTGSEENSELVSRTRNRRKKTGKIKLPLLILAGIVLVYLIAAIFVGTRGRVTKTVALSGTVSENFRATGYVFREQTIINSPKTGYLECMVSEGERVKEGQTVAYVFPEKPSDDIIEKMKSVQRLIALQGLGGEGVEYTSDSAMTESNIASLSRNLSDKRSYNSLSGISDKKNEINLILNNKASADAEKKKTPRELEDELSELNAKAGMGTAVTASVGGVFSSRFDGFEDALDVKNVTKVTVSYLNELDKKETSGIGETVIGQPICKIVNNYKWYYGAVVDAEKVKDIKEGQTVSLEFFDFSSTAVKGTVSRISEADGDKRAIVVSSNRFIDGIYSVSRANANIVTVSANGIKLPAECLRVKDGVTGVFVIRLDTARFAPVNVIYRNDEWAVVSAVEGGGAKLQIYDDVIVSGRNIEDGKRVGK